LVLWSVRVKQRYAIPAAIIVVLGEKKVRGRSVIRRDQAGRNDCLSIVPTEKSRQFVCGQIPTEMIKPTLLSKIDIAIWTYGWRRGRINVERACQSQVANVFRYQGLTVKPQQIMTGCRDVNC